MLHYFLTFNSTLKPFAIILVCNPNDYRLFKGFRLRSVVSYDEHNHTCIDYCNSLFSSLSVAAGLLTITNPSGFQDSLTVYVPDLRRPYLGYPHANPAPMSCDTPSDRCIQFVNIMPPLSLCNKQSRCVLMLVYCNNLNDFILSRRLLL